MLNPGRTFVIASNVFREVIRDRILYLIGLYAIAIGGASLVLPYLAASTEDKILLDVGLAAIALLGLLVAVFVGTGLVNKEIEKRTVSVLIAKPISRAEFIVGKHWGLSAVLAVLIFAMTAILMLLLSLQQVPYPAGSLWLAALFLVLELSLITAVAILFGVFTSSILAMLLTLAVYAMGHISRDLVQLGELVDQPGWQQVTQVLYLVLPDLSRLDLKNQAVYGLALIPQPLELVSHAAYGLIYTTLMLAIATAIFARRQF
jgi:ABC-type transport system involved in multi-copper enzyme maturation permease subunit